MRIVSTILCDNYANIVGSNDVLCNYYYVPIVCFRTNNDDDGDVEMDSAYEKDENIIICNVHTCAIITFCKKRLKYSICVH